MKELIQRNLSGKRILLLFILTSIVYAVMLSITIPMVLSHAPKMKLLDMMPGGYTPEYVNTLLNALGPEGRNAYLTRQIPVDMVYPFLFGITYCLLLAYFLNKLGKSESKLFYLSLLPLISAVFDYLENFGIIAILKSYPDNSDSLSKMTCIFSVLKSSTTTIFFIVLIVTVIAFVIQLNSRKKA